MNSKIETIAKAIRQYRIECEHMECVLDEIDRWNVRVRCVGDKINPMVAQTTMISLNKQLADAQTARKAARNLMDVATPDELTEAKLLVKTQYEMFGHPNYIPSTYNDRWW